ncbi:hypothetical protein B0H10DRAFT_1758826, partial [Mycena sp. CBHHK59/15]
YGCPDCGKTAGRKVVQNHMTSADHGRNRQPLENLYAQVLNPGSTRTNIRITPHEAEELDVSTGSPDLLTQIKAFNWQDHRNGNIPNARMISPWLLRTRWHEQVQPYRENHADLIWLVSMPGSDDTDMKNLHKTVRKYYDQATNLIDGTDELVLQIINSSDPKKEGYNNTPLHRHHQGAKTLAADIVPVTHLLAGLLRHSDHYTFPSSPQLTTALGDLKDDDRSEDALHAVLMALWKTTWSATEQNQFPDPTMCFLMMFSLKKGGEFANPKDTTGPIAKLCRGIRLAMLVELHKILKSGNLQHYATSLAYQTMALPDIWWLDQGKWEEMLFQGQKITLSQIKEILANLEVKIIDTWKNEVLMGIDLRASYDVISDTLGNSETGYNFINDIRNGQFRRSKNALVVAIFNDPKLAKMFTQEKQDGSGGVELNPKVCRGWLTNLAELEGMCMVLTEYTSGAPIRGTQLSSMLGCNTWNRLRNWMALGRFLAIISQYTKTTNTSQKDRLIPHALSAVVSDILIQIHAIARPFAQYLAKEFFPGRNDVVTQYGELLFMDCGKPFTSDRLSFKMAQYSTPILLWEIKLSIWRHLGIAIRRKRCGWTETFEEEETANTVHALQSCHSLETERTTYGLSQDALLGAPEDVLYLYLRASQDWQKEIGVVPGGLGLSYEEATMDKFDELVARGKIKMQLHGRVTKEAVATASGVVLDPALNNLFLDFREHSQKVSTTMLNKQDKTLELLSELVAGQKATNQLISKLQGDVAELRAGLNIRPASDVGRLTPLPSSPTPFDMPLPPSSPPRQAPQTPQTPPQLYLTSRSGRTETMPPSIISHSAEQTSRLSSDVSPANLLVHLRKMYGPNADWKSQEQYTALRQVLKLEGDVIVAIRTAGGKTPIAILPSFVEEGYTVIVLPSTALAEDWVRRLDKMKIPYERFLGAQSSPVLHGKHNLILVSGDTKSPVVRFVVDEAQYYYTDHTFREALDNPFLLRVFPFQLVLMGATIPHPAEEFLKRQFMVTSPTRISSISDRPELEVRILEPYANMEDLVEGAKDLINTVMKVKQWKPIHRYLVFVHSFADGKCLSQELQVPFYHANTKDHPIDDQVRKKIYTDWINGMNPGLVTTTAITAGNDYDHVMFTMHIGTPFNLVTFEQQRTRAARDG